MHYFPSVKNPPSQFHQRSPSQRLEGGPGVWLNQLALSVTPAEAVRVSAPLGGQLPPLFRIGSLGVQPAPSALAGRRRPGEAALPWT